MLKTKIMTKKLYENDGGTRSSQSKNTSDSKKSKGNKLFFALVAVGIIATVLFIILN